MEGLMVNTKTMCLKSISNLNLYLHMMKYGSCKEYNSCEYFFKIYGTRLIQLKDKTGVRVNKDHLKTLVKQLPTELSYTSDGSYLRVVWETHNLIIGDAFTSAKKYDLPRRK